MTFGTVKEWDMATKRFTKGDDMSGGMEEMARAFVQIDRQFAEREQRSALNKQVGGGHYKDLKIQPIEYIHANNIPFAEGCAIKYLTRWRDKGGIGDLEKARHFIDMLIELESQK